MGHTVPVYEVNFCCINGFRTYFFTISLSHAYHVSIMLTISLLPSLHVSIMLTISLLPSLLAYPYENSLLHKSGVIRPPLARSACSHIKIENSPDKNKNCML